MFGRGLTKQLLSKLLPGKITSLKREWKDAMILLLHAAAGYTRIINIILLLFLYLIHSNVTKERPVITQNTETLSKSS